MPKSGLIWSNNAMMNLREIGAVIAEDRPGVAKQVVDAIVEKVELLTTFPQMGRIVPEIEREDVRELFHKSYRIVYRISDHQVVVLSVFHWSRRLPDLNNPPPNIH